MLILSCSFFSSFSYFIAIAYCHSCWYIDVMPHIFFFSFAFLLVVVVVVVISVLSIAFIWMCTCMSADIVTFRLMVMVCVVGYVWMCAVLLHFPVCIPPVWNLFWLVCVYSSNKVDVFFFILKNCFVASVDPVVEINLSKVKKERHFYFEKVKEIWETEIVSLVFYVTLEMR